MDFYPRVLLRCGTAPVKSVLSFMFPGYWQSCHCLDTQNIVHTWSTLEDEIELAKWQGN